MMMAGPSFRISLALATTSPSAGEDIFHQIVFLTEELAALVVVLYGDARTGEAVVGDDLIDKRERHRLVIGLAEIVDDDLDGWRRPRSGGRWRLGVVGRARAIGDQRKQRGEHDDCGERAGPWGERSHHAKEKQRGRIRTLHLGLRLHSRIGSARCRGGRDGEAEASR